MSSCSSLWRVCDAVDQLLPLLSAHHSIVWCDADYYGRRVSIYSAVHDAVSVCPSVTSRCSIETTEWIELIFGTEATLGLPKTVLQRNLGTSKTKGTSFLDLVPNSEQPIFLLFATTGLPSQLLSTVASLLYWAPTFVYNTVTVSYRVARRFVCDSWDVLKVTEQNYTRYRLQNNVLILVLITATCLFVSAYSGQSPAVEQLRLVI